MRMARFFLALAILAGTVLYFSSMRAKPSDSPTPRRAVVVELFTSEGCSSCPPADELLGHLRQDMSGRNVQVIPLGFHVDYWNSLGWKDRFSSADFSQRQEQYARSLGGDGPYTPQMVVDGEVEFVGNSALQAERAITQAAGQTESAEVKLTADTGDQLVLSVKGPGSVNGANVLLAVTEDNLTTQVGAGENSGHTLHHAAVVRELRRLGQLSNGRFNGGAQVKLQPDWKRADLRAVVFVQDGPAGKILGAASVPLASQTR
jgi:hypothetical protein